MKTGQCEEKTFTFLIVHGVEGYPTENWFDWLKRQLEGRGHHVVVPQFPTRLPPEKVTARFFGGMTLDYATFAGQTLMAWMQVAQEVTHGWNPDRTILVGHSLGGLTVLRLAEQAREMPYHAVVAVSPVVGQIGLPDYDPGMVTFYQDMDQKSWDDIRLGSREIVVYASPDDPIVPYDMSRRVARLAQADRFITVDQAGHFNAAAGYHEFPLLLDYVNSVIRKKPKSFAAGA